MILVSVSWDWPWSQSHETGLSLSLGLEFYPLLGLGLSPGLKFWRTPVSVLVSNFVSLWSQSPLGLKKVGLADLCYPPCRLAPGWLLPCLWTADWSTIIIFHMDLWTSRKGEKITQPVHPRRYVMDFDYARTFIYYPWSTSSLPDVPDC